MLPLLSWLLLSLFDETACAAYTFETIPRSTDFCKLKCGFKKHICCIYGHAFGPACLSRPIVQDIDNDEKNMILDSLNTIRNEVASGNSSREDLRGMTASNMNVLSYSKELAFTASCWAKQCTPNHSRCKAIGEGMLGETVCFGKGFNRKLYNYSRNLVPRCPNFFIRNFPEFTTAIIDQFKLPLGGDDERHRETVQMIWALTQFIGCSRIAYPHEERGFSTILIICHFYPRANVLGQSVFKRGKPCAECEGLPCNAYYPNLCGTMRDSTEDYWIPPLLKSRDDTNKIQILEIVFVIILQIANRIHL